MELVARHFSCYPTDSPAYERLGPLFAAIGDVRFPVTIGTRNNNQLTYCFDPQIKSKLLAAGAASTELPLPREIRQKYDFAFAYQNHKVVVEVEKANWEKILRDLLKFHIYFKYGA